MKDRESQDVASHEDIARSKKEVIESRWYLHAGDFFANLSREKDLFISCSKERIAKKNEIIFRQGEEGKAVYYLQRGEVGIFYTTPLGKESIVFIRHAGDIFGLAEAIRGVPRTCGARAINDCCLYELRRKELETLLSQNWALARRVIEILGSRLRFLGEQIENFISHDVTTRLLKVLFYMTFKEISVDSLGDSSSVMIPIKLTQGQLASMIGSCQQTVSEILKQLEEAGIIKVSKNRRIEIDPHKILKSFKKI